MNRSLHFGTALCVTVIAATLPGCATGNHKQSVQPAKAAASNLGLATRALAAMNSGDFATAVTLAEQAVAGSPNQAALRLVLANAYFGAGRFASAETTYRDSLGLGAEQPDIVLKMVLAQIAQGKSAQALGNLDATRDFLEPADHGLALALAGRPADAVAVLGQAAREPGADARVRQNLALAHALAGDWTMARTIAAQDVPADQLDRRIQQWMAMASPRSASDQVAALTGIVPAADSGQPVHLALNKAQPVQPGQPAQRVAEAAPAEPMPLPVNYAEPEPVQYEAEAAPVQVAAALIEPAASSAPAPALPASFAKPDIAEYVPVRARRTVRAAGRSNSVVQLGAYGSPERVAAAWNQDARSYASLGRYTPVSARFDGPKGTVYRLSVKGFASLDEAQRLCAKLQQSGKSCFVRRVAGDSPVRMASR